MAAILRNDFAAVGANLVGPVQKRNFASLHDWLVDEVGLAPQETAIAVTNYQQGRFGRMPNHILLVTTDRIAYTHDGGMRSVPLSDIDRSRIGINGGLVNGEVTLQLLNGERLNFRRGVSRSMQEVAAALTTASPGSSVPTAPDPVEPVGENVIRGFGDDVFTFGEPTDGYLFLRITGNRECGAFSVWALGPGLEPQDLLVNQTSPYSGVVLVGHQAPVGGLKFDAPGAWTLEILNLDAAPTLDGGASGVGDSVVLASPDLTPTPGAKVARIEISPSMEPSAVSVWAWGTAPDLLVNEAGGYSGTVLIPAGTQLLQVTAPAGWTIDLK